MRRKTVVVELSRGMIRATAVQGRKKTMQGEASWDENNLQDRLGLIKEKFDTEVIRLILSDDISYTKIKYLKEGVRPVRAELRKEVMGEFPDLLGEMWDYKIDETEQGERVVLIFAPVKRVMDQFVTAAEQVGIKIESVDPKKFVMMRGEDIIMTTAKKNLKGSDEQVLNLRVEVVEDDESVKELENSPKQESTSLEDVDDEGKVQEKKQDLPKVESQENLQSVQPMQTTTENSLVKKIDDSGEMGRERNKLESQIKLVDNNNNKSKSKSFIIIILIIAVSALVGVAVWRANTSLSQRGVSQGGEEVIVVNPVASMAPTPTPSPTPEPVELGELEVEILNGSGVAGEAGVVQEMLVAEGFGEELIEVGNADSYDHLDTEVRVKAGLSEQIYQEIKRALNSDYQVVMGEDLTEDYRYDAVVIVGTKIVEGAE